MEATIYREMSDLENHHWWFLGRRRILGRVLDSLQLPPDARVLEAGCGTGGNLALLARYGRLAAFELDDEARSLANARGIVEVQPGRLPDEMPFDEPFDLIVLPDVLEHVEDDNGALRALAERLAPGGRLLLTVPAFDFLWSHHDVVHHHFRRYTRGRLVPQVERAGLRVAYAGYFNTFLFPVVCFARWVNRVLGRREGSDFSVPAPWVNGCLKNVFAAERWLVPRWRLPFGVSLLIIAERAAQ